MDKTEIAARATGVFDWMLASDLDPFVYMQRLGLGVAVVGLALMLLWRWRRGRGRCKWRQIPNLQDDLTTRWICRTCGEDAMTRGLKPETCLARRR